MADEAVLHYIWKHGLYKKESLRDRCGRELLILFAGRENLHAGPDFLCARIRIDGLTWIGNVEIHIRSSDWYKHGHHLDAAYNNVILHVTSVWEKDVKNSKGRIIPSFVPVYPGKLHFTFETLQKQEGLIPCAALIRDLPGNKLSAWLSDLYLQRFERQKKRIRTLMQIHGPCSDRVPLLALARGFGLPANAFPFEMLAGKLPYPELLKQGIRRIDMEALLFGYSGLLDSYRGNDSYPLLLREKFLEQADVRKKYPLPSHLWKFLRIRPLSFPTIRISQFSSLLLKAVPLGFSLSSLDSLAEAEQLFRCRASTYWDTHYLFGRATAFQPKFTGRSFSRNIMINILFPYRKILEESCAGKKPFPAEDIMKELYAESNYIIREWTSLGIVPKNALESQSLMELYHSFCKQNRCTDCQVYRGLLRFL